MPALMKRQDGQPASVPGSLNSGDDGRWIEGMARGASEDERVATGCMRELLLEERAKWREDRDVPNAGAALGGYGALAPVSGCPHLDAIRSQIDVSGLQRLQLAASEPGK